MALKKTYSGQRELYARIARMVIGKRWSPEIIVEVVQREPETGAEFLLHEWQFLIDRKEALSAPFKDAAFLDEQGENPYRTAYIYLKENILFFADFEDA